MDHFDWVSENLEADAGFHQLSGPWAKCHIRFPIPWSWYKPWVWEKALRLPLLIIRKSVWKVKGRNLDL